jgi:hypothetical protein
MRYRRIAIATFFCLHATIAVACNVPVFRYALERWRPDLCEVIVFHDGRLAAEQEKQLQLLDRESTENGGHSNIRVIRSLVNEEKDSKRVALWDTVRSKPGVVLPYVVIRTALGTGEMVNHWHGQLDSIPKANVTQSPVRRELSKRLLKGDSVVWLLLKSDNTDKNDTTRRLLEDELKSLSKKLELPDGIGLPGSELYSEVPLFLKFTVLEIDRHDPNEELLVKLLSGFEPESSNEPLLAPVFGRGRALEVIPARQLDAGMIGDLTLFLCGACSCQVKERNPGFDLLLTTDWNQELYGEESQAPPPVTTLERAPTKPTLLTIPPGRKKN